VCGGGRRVITVRVLLRGERVVEQEEGMGFVFKNGVAEGLCGFSNSTKEEVAGDGVFKSIKGVAGT
jgi:hypothetical protein